MKSFFTCIILFYTLQIYPVNTSSGKQKASLPVAENLFIITTDGFRWQEVFTGADSSLISDETFTPDTAFMKMLYWDNKQEERKKKLMPFFWSVLATKGQLFGNRNLDSKVDVANPYSLSYPGYNEMFTGNMDIGISSNRKIKNPNINVLEHLLLQPSFHNKVVAFTSWDVFPYILNTSRSRLPVNSGYENMEGDISDLQEKINTVQDGHMGEKTATRNDQLTFLNAKEYIRLHRPRVAFIGFGETDEFAHEGRYDLYLQQANKVDQMIAELWHWVQTTPGYKDNTIFMITTDHGRGSKRNKWTSHGQFIKGSSQAWLALIGPGILPVGEIKVSGQVYQQQLAKTMAGFLGEGFDPHPGIAPAITLLQ